ncbi:MAG: hypothetical protein M1816_008037 [Peltula sp. TS41687]|nr:MAG: hypothetical protein M1816_008037 [Peltula sp. TS41687]
MFPPRLHRAIILTRQQVWPTNKRWVSTLQGHPEIYVLPDSRSLSNSHLLSFLPTEPPTPELAIGTTTELPPTPNSFEENPRFLAILQDVLAEHACEDPGVKSQAAAMASTAGSTLGSGTVLFPQKQRDRGRRGLARRYTGDGGGAASSTSIWIEQRLLKTIYIHVSDGRNVPEFGRIAEPQDIFGSLEVDGQGSFVGGHGWYQPSGTYRLVTRKGM